MDYAQLRAAKALIDTPEKWIQGAEATNADNERVLVTSEEAVCFCAIGAIAKVGLDRGGPEVCALVERANELFPCDEFDGGEYQNVPDFNDCLAHDAVMAIFDGVLAQEPAQ